MYHVLKKGKGSVMSPDVNIVGGAKTDGCRLTGMRQCTSTLNPASQDFSDDIAIRVCNLGKCYQIYDRSEDRLKQFLYPPLQKMVGLKPKSYCRDFWALDSVSFEVRKGETIGVIGRNGSGKSTLLQLICGILAPSAGSIGTTGRIAAILELGTGFNPAFTGRENVHMNGAILGLARDEVDAKLSSIAAFADIGEFMEQPVRTYSSGMLVRLAFAVLVCLNPGILVIDEALAVGDMNFQAKCITALDQMQQQGVTMLFVSHDLGIIKTLCSRGIYLEKGRVRSIGPAGEVAGQYERDLREERNAESRKLISVPKGSVPKPSGVIADTASDLKIGEEVFKRSHEFDKRASLFRYGSGGARITYTELLNVNDDQIEQVEFDQEVKIRIYVETSSDRDISVKFNVFDDKRVNLTGCDFFQAGRALLHTHCGGNYLVEYLLRLPLQAGNYSLRVQVTSAPVNKMSAEFLDVVENAVVFKMAPWERATMWSKIHLFPKLNLKKLD
jgi:lipopolysaccharide transport system ATP-binding protein